METTERKRERWESYCKRNETQGCMQVSTHCEKSVLVHFSTTHLVHRIYVRVTKCRRSSSCTVTDPLVSVLSTTSIYMSRLLLLFVCVVSAQMCTINTDCQEGQTCEERTCYDAVRSLYQPCSQRFPCLEGLQCVSGRCYHSPATLNEPCLVDAQCAGGLTCDSSYSVCKERDYSSL